MREVKGMYEVKDMNEAKGMREAKGMYEVKDMNEDMSEDDMGGFYDSEGEDSDRDSDGYECGRACLQEPSELEMEHIARQAEAVMGGIDEASEGEG